MLVQFFVFRQFFATLLLLVVAFTASSIAFASVRVNLPQTQQEADQEQDDDAIINLAAKGILDLPGLVQWASELEKFQLILDNDAFRQTQNRVVFVSRVDVDRNTLMLLVQEVLRANGFALVESQVPGWKRVANLSNVAPFSPIVDVNDINQLDYQYVSAIFQLKHLSAENAKTQLTGLLPGGALAAAAGDNVRAVAGTRILVVSDQVINIRRVERLLSQIDIPREREKYEFYKVKHLEAQELKSQLDAILTQIGETGAFSRDPASETESATTITDAVDTTAVRISSDLRTNRLILIGHQSGIDAVMRLIEQLDVPLDLTLNTYRFEHIAAKKIDDLVRQSLAGVSSESLERIYQSTIDSQTNQLVVTARSEIHEQIVRLKQQLDNPQSAAQQNLMKFYTLKNVKASDILQTLQSVERQVRTDTTSSRTPMDGILSRPGFEPAGPNYLNQFREGPPVTPPSAGSMSNLNQASTWPTDQGVGPGTTMIDELSRLLDTPAGEKLIPGNAKITVDDNTNTLIIVAEPDVQALYAQLIEKLDRRRPQVMIEAHVVVIEGRDNLNLGVELSGGDRLGARRLFSFTSYGLSEIDPTNGALQILPGVGFNGALVDPETADVVLRALARHQRARVVTSPRIVVDDNANGILSSVAEEPFSSVNATNTVATTSFAGFAQAGTTINVTPRISEGDHLNLVFDILVNNFTGPSTPNLPPPRNTDQIVSQVTIPDGYTVIVGGLNRRRVAEDLQGLPLATRIPILRLLTSLQTRERSEAMLFVFLKPVILRDDKFRDLIYLSEVNQGEACVEGDYPKSAPVLIK